jgi:hypothetical protein
VCSAHELSTNARQQVCWVSSSGSAISTRYLVQN